jgi:hypothetical protein
MNSEIIATNNLMYLSCDNIKYKKLILKYITDPINFTGNSTRSSSKYIIPLILKFLYGK